MEKADVSGWLVLCCDVLNLRRQGFSDCTGLSCISDVVKEMQEAWDSFDLLQ